MIGHLAYATGSPCPTLVIDSRTPPERPETMLARVTEARVGHKAVTYQGSFLMEPLAHQQFEEIARCLAVTPNPA